MVLKVYFNMVIPGNIVISFIRYISKSHLKTLFRVFREAAFLTLIVKIRFLLGYVRRMRNRWSERRSLTPGIENQMNALWNQELFATKSVPECFTDCSLRKRRLISRFFNGFLLFTCTRNRCEEDNKSRHKVELAKNLRNKTFSTLYREATHLPSRRILHLSRAFLFAYQLCCRLWRAFPPYKLVTMTTRQSLQNSKFLITFSVMKYWWAKIQETSATLLFR